MLEIGGFLIKKIKIHIKKTRMTLFIKTKLKKSDDQTNIGKNRSKLIFLRIIIPKKILVRIICRVVTLSTFFLTVSGIII